MRTRGPLRGGVRWGGPGHAVSVVEARTEIQRPIMLVFRLPPTSIDVHLHAPTCAYV
ncbi:hypothetical protein T261_3891 [Streptomyces lydicus]|nr:hypothetical protein T261_3891 [Streptomyces lydicus]